MERHGPIQVRVMSAANLLAVNGIKGLSDPYCTVKIIRTGNVYISNKCLNTVDPKWYETFVFDGVRADDVLEIRCIDHNVITEDVDLGAVHIQIGKALEHSRSVFARRQYAPPPPLAIPPSLYGSEPALPYYQTTSSLPPPDLCYPSSEPSSQALYDAQSRIAAASLENASAPPLDEDLSRSDGVSLYPQDTAHSSGFSAWPQQQPLPPTSTGHPLPPPTSASYSGYIPSYSPPHPSPYPDVHTSTAPFVGLPSSTPQQSQPQYSQAPPSVPPPQNAYNPYAQPPPPLFVSPPTSMLHTSPYQFENQSPLQQLQQPPHQAPYLAPNSNLYGALGSSVSTSGSVSSNQYSKLAADYFMQLAMTQTHSVNPQGLLNVLVTGCWLSDLSETCPGNTFRMFVNQKFTEKVSNATKLPFQSTMVGRTMVGRSLGRVIRVGADAVQKPLHPLLDVIHPVQDALKEHPTWKIGMWHVKEVFGTKRQPWNRKYAAAQTIFEGTGSFAVRRIVKGQHAYLYGGTGGIKPLVDIRKELSEKTGVLLGGLDFVEIFNCGVRRGKSRMFTYVLMEERLYIAETGAKLFRDNFSKHAMHSSAAAEVVYAGELHFRRRHEPPGFAEPEYDLILDNNSGTYAPSKAELPNVREAFVRNFAGLRVEALDHADPKLKQYKQELELVNAGRLSTRAGESSEGSGVYKEQVCK